MALYALSDLHLSLSEDKPMDIFGDNWSNHDQKIIENWKEKITKEDTVLIAGDISWSINIKEGIKELDWIHELPGKKILAKGNHDYWWSGIKKLNGLYEDMNFIQNNSFSYKDYAICGSRGWIIPFGENVKEQDRKIYRREIIRLKLSLDHAKSQGYSKIIVMLHYPPFMDKIKNTEITELMREYKVEKVIYGHLHGPSLKNAFQGKIYETEYIITSADYLNFNPIKILD
ncbi:metallophosphoesterase [Haloimpatiens sp. FM7315]|uniref:metallophosphoesterase n=1 Tax=Haloimpatiens sp. FM7315 TaxID=3298609 RepID=UPI00370ACA23